ncbi:MAG: glutamate synthase subunit alpha, partial [Acidobacteria bacterium]
MNTSAPARQGLYDPTFEHDACGVGFVADVQGRKSHEIVASGLEVLMSLRHRGACGCEENTGDGAGILLQLPHRFLARECDGLGIELPGAGSCGAGMVFLPTDAGERRRCEEIFEEVVRGEGQSLLGWRTVPTDDSMIGRTARAGEPAIRQVFVGRSPQIEDPAAFERRLYIIRKQAERAVKASGLASAATFYLPSLSSRTIIYKGMLKADQLPAFYPDILDPELESALALVHSRFSTNTFPSWGRAHPYRYICHNGEINTLRGNVNWMHARERMFESGLFGPEIAKILPVIDPDGSDTAMFDNALEMLLLTGRQLPHAIMMMIPEPWSGDEKMGPEKRA